MTNHVLITGAAGFIGRHLAREFSRKNWRVVGMGRSTWNDWREYGIAEWNCCDVTLETLAECGGNPDVIVHCAGGSSVGFSVEQPAIDFDSTVRTTSDVLEFIRMHSSATRLVYPSSAAVYGQIEMMPIVEDASLNPVSPYGFHKQMAESLCKLYSHQFGVSAAIVRLFSIYGAGLRKQLLWDACRKLEQGEYEFFGTGEEIRDWLHVNDVAKLLFIAGQNATPDCPVVNAGSGQGVTVKDILTLVSEHWVALEKPIFSSKPKAGDPNAYMANIAKARTWNWEPEINWREGVAEYVDWYKQCQ